MTEEPFDNYRDMAQLPLDSDERFALQTLVQSEGWKVALKVLSHHRRAILSQLVLTKDDIRYFQGKYAGFKEAEVLISEYAKSIMAFRMETFPDEMKLNARK